MSMSDAALQVQAASGNGSADLLDDPNAADNSGGDYESGRAVGGQGGMAKRRASSAMSVVSRALRISNFPPEMQAMLTDAFDKDGDGHIGSSELVESARLTIEMRNCNRMLWKGLGLAVFVVFVMVGVNAGLTYGIIDASRDTEVEGQSLMVRDADGEAEVPVATSTNKVSVTLATLPFLPSSAVSQIDNMAFTSEDGGTVYHKKVQSVVVTPETSMRLKTTDGDVVEWGVGDGQKMSITLEDGTAWKTCVYCTECTAANVYSTPEILAGLDNFETMTGKVSRRHLGTYDSVRVLSRRLGYNGRGDATNCVNYTATLEDCCAAAWVPGICTDTSSNSKCTSGCAGGTDSPTPSPTTNPTASPTGSPTPS